MSGHPQDLLSPVWPLWERELGCLQIRAVCPETFRPRARAESLGSCGEEGRLCSAWRPLLQVVLLWAPPASGPPSRPAGVLQTGHIATLSDRFRGLPLPQPSLSGPCHPVPRCPSIVWTECPAPVCPWRLGRCQGQSSAAWACSPGAFPQWLMNNCGETSTPLVPSCPRGLSPRACGAPRHPASAFLCRLEGPCSLRSSRHSRCCPSGAQVALLWHLLDPVPADAHSPVTWPRWAACLLLIWATGALD